MFAESPEPQIAHRANVACADRPAALWRVAASNSQLVDR
jgi:hypothetical protein